MESQGVGHDWVTEHTHMHTRTSKQTCNSTMFLHWFSLMNESILYYIAVLPVQPLTHNRKLINVHSVNYYSNDAIFIHAAADAVKSLQSCPTLCDPIDSSPPGSAVPGILQARTLEWAAISLSNAWKWKVKVKSLSHVWLLVIPWTAAYQAPLPMGFSRQEYWSGVPLPSP